MPDSTLGSLLNDTNNVLTATTISGVGGIANYLYQVKKGEAFKLGMFCINAGLAAWLGYVATGFVDVDSKMFWPTLSLIGFCTWPLLKLIEAKVPEMWARMTNQVK